MRPDAVTRAARALATYALVAVALELGSGVLVDADARAAGAPRGFVFALFHAFMLGKFAGSLATCVPPLPQLSMQMLAGVILRNLPGPRAWIGSAVPRDGSYAFRALALGVILTRAGLAMDAKKALATARETLSLAIVPASMEMLVASGLGMVFFGLTTAEAFALGFLMCGISLAVVVPPMVEFSANGFAREVPDLILSASSIDGIYCIVGFGIVSSVVFASSGGSANDLAWRVPAQLVVGGVGGWFLAEASVRSSLLSSPGRANTAFMDAAVIVSVVMVIVFASKELETSGGGALMSIVFCVSVAEAWKRSGIEDALKATSAVMNTFWAEFTAPMLFVIIGCTLDLHVLEAGDAGKAIGIICLAGVARAAGVFLATAKSAGMDLRERAFIALAWTPKATIQAALASVVYDQALTTHGVDSDEAANGKKLLVTTLLSILITAPLGAWCIAYFAPKCLKRENKEVRV
jgi:NhaP-type Na+/H+ or K+/H+ antiporter